jgi:hypothetical protein
MDGREDEAVASVAVPLTAQNGGAPPLLGQAKEEEAATTPVFVLSVSQKQHPSSAGVG